MQSEALKLTPCHEESNENRACLLSDYLEFVVCAKDVLKRGVSEQNEHAQSIREPLEDRYLDDRGQPAMYQRCESAIYDDASRFVGLWDMFHRKDRRQLVRFQRLAKMDLDGLNGDRHPRKIFDRSPFGIAALLIGTITIWMTFVKNITGDDSLKELLELVRFNWIAGTVWIGGLFVVLWYILKTVRNNHQVATLATINRALTIYLAEEHAQGRLAA